MPQSINSCISLVLAFGLLDWLLLFVAFLCAFGWLLLDGLDILFGLLLLLIFNFLLTLLLLVLFVQFALVEVVEHRVVVGSLQILADLE